MMKIEFLFLIFVGSSLGFLFENSKDQPTKSRIPKFGHFCGGNLVEPFSEKNQDLLEITQHSITQPLDHFNLSDSEIWEQRYWKNSNFYVPGGPIFLIISGDTEANEIWISNPNVTYLQWAKNLNAMVFLLEHRFYGKSQPTEDLSDENLKYLSSKQALEDIQNFIKNISEEFASSKWITFGGSYAGMLSAWFREKYPKSAVGAVGSSAPLNIKTNFFEYLQVVQRSIFEYDIKCARNIAYAFSDIFASLYDPNKVDILNTVFNLSKILSNENDSFQKDSKVFFSSLISAFQAAVQFSGINTNEYEEGGYGIENVCEIMMQQGSNYNENLQNVYSYMNQNDDIIDSDYLKNVELLNDTSFDGINSEIRAWLWQSCTEFGYFQTTDLGRNIFGSTVSLDFYIDLCFDVFGLKRDDIDISLYSTKQFYGNLSNVTNLALIYGSHDPWHALGYYAPTNSDSYEVTSFFINGTSHCADMYPSSDLDPPELVSARDQIEKLIYDWIN